MKTRRISIVVLLTFIALAASGCGYNTLTAKQQSVKGKWANVETQLQRRSDLINNLVESGVGVSLIRDEIATQSVDAGRSVIWPGSHVTTKLWLVHLADRAGDPLLAALDDVLRDAWQSKAAEPRGTGSVDVRTRRSADAQI